MKRLTFVLLLWSLSFCFSHDELSDQVKAITAKIRLEPKRADLYFQRAELYRADFHWNNAEADYKTAKKLDADMIATDLGLGLLYLQTGQLHSSRAALDRFLKVKPEHAEGRVARGHALSQLGQIDAAIEDYSLALKVRPDPEIYIERSRLLASRNQIQQAVHGLDEGIERLGSVVTLELSAIDLELQLKRYNDALKRIDRIAAQSERKETWLARKGEILLQASRIEEARAAFESARQALESLPQSRRNNRYTQELEQQIQNALEQLPERSIE